MSKNKPTVGVIISTYNSPHYLKRVLEGYLFQRCAPDELIVADDGSTQETAEVVEQFRQRAPFPVLHVWHEDAGFRLSKIRNEAIKASSAHYLIFSDGDCLPHPEFVGDHRQAAQQGCFVAGKRMLLSERVSAEFSPYGGLANLLKEVVSGDISGWHHLLRLPCISWKGQRLRGIKGCNLAFFKADLEQVNGFNESFVGWGREDSELVVRLFRLGRSRKDLPFAAALYHLWHRVNSRESLPENDAILQAAMDSPAFSCTHGIVKQG
jgi:glycosyltransferase involved in cell wall biosynthesis